MARTRIGEFGIIQKTLALATVGIYIADDNGENTGVLADIYQASSGSEKRSNPQVLNEDGKLDVDCWVGTPVMAEITNISLTTERAIRKIKNNPLQYPLPLTSAAVYGANVSTDSAAAVAAAATATTKAAEAAADAVTTGNNVTASTAAKDIAVTKAAEAEDAADRAENAAALLPLNNYAATTDPGVGDDSVDGYSNGSQWLNTSTGDRFICSSAAVGAAVWEDVTGLAPEDLGTAALEDIGFFATAAQGALAETALQADDFADEVESAIGFNTYAESPEYTIAAAGTINEFTHALGARPKRVDVLLRCKTAEYGWAVDSEVVIAPSHFNGSANYAGYTVGWDLTKVYLVQGVEETIRHRTTGAAVSTATAANWRYFIRVWA